MFSQGPRHSRAGVDLPRTFGTNARLLEMAKLMRTVDGVRAVANFIAVHPACPSGLR
jgi:hypothetical protein